ETRVGERAGLVVPKTGTGQTQMSGSDEKALYDHQPLFWSRNSAKEKTSGERARADADQDDGEQKREHGTEFAQQEREVTEPEDFHSHRRKAGQREGQAGPRETRRCRRRQRDGLGGGG